MSPPLLSPTWWYQQTMRHKHIVMSRSYISTMTRWQARAGNCAIIHYSTFERVTCCHVNKSPAQILMSDALSNYRTVSWTHAPSRLIRGQYPGHVITLNQSEVQRPVSRSRDHSPPIRGQYPGYVITHDQSEASIQGTWSLSTNQRPVSRSCDHLRPIRD